MGNGPVQLALREVRATYADRRALAIMGGVGIVAGLTGPFNTFDILNLPLRLIYWMAIAFGTYGAGVFGAVLAQRMALPSNKPLWLSIPVMGLGASIPVTLVVVALNLSFLPASRVSVIDALWLYPYCLAICTALMALEELVAAPAFERQAAMARPDAIPLMERLPPETRGPLSHMSMADHYVEVFTSRGKAMILMRLADAMKETQGVPGFQIHRSHWVAKDAIKGIRRIEGKTMIETKSGTLLPVSRSFIPTVRAAME